MCVVDTPSFTVSACDTGNLYLWTNLSLVYIVKTHEASIQAMLALTHDTFVTGSLDGSIIVTQIKPKDSSLIKSFTLQQLFPQPSSNSSTFQPGTHNVKYCIQALTLENDTLYVGTKCGSIYSIPFHD